MKAKSWLDYVWLDGISPQTLKSKIKVIDTASINKPRVWNFDGSSTNQAQTESSELILKPIRSFKNPFIKDSFILLNEVTNMDGTPHSTNKRRELVEILKPYNHDDFKVGIEQEYFILDPNDSPPNTREKRGLSYCGVGHNNTFGRDIAEEHADLCLKAGISISGINAEVSYSQWEYQVGMVDILDGCDQLWISRYILEKLAEKRGLVVIWHPKPFQGINGSGMHVNISSKQLREDMENKRSLAISYCEKLGKNIQEHIDVYGEFNELRLTGGFETCSINEFKWGIGDRTASIRIPSSIDDKTTPGYIEDRRPASNANPYEVMRVLVKTLSS